MRQRQRDPQGRLRFLHGVRVRGAVRVSTANVLWPAPAAGFDAPFEMLEACHERVERSLRLLERLGEHLQRNGADAQAQDAARDILRYFDIAAPHHHEDEERHVLPALRASGHAVVADRIAADHAVMHTAWQQLRVQLQAVQAGAANDAASAEVQAHWREFAALYRRHLELENATAFPVARAALDAQRLRAMGQEMARRRGVTEMVGDQRQL
jgi:hemerythrin-like domain-containing protein